MSPPSPAETQPAQAGKATHKQKGLIGKATLTPGEAQKLGFPHLMKPRYGAVCGLLLVERIGVPSDRRLPKLILSCWGASKDCAEQETGKH